MKKQKLSSYFFSLIVFSAFFFNSCVHIQQKPSLINVKNNAFQDEQKLHDLFQSFWLPPLLDKASLNVGILTQKNKIEFKTLHNSKFFILNNNKPFIIQAPKNTHWIIDQPQVIRPALIRYYPSVDIQNAYSSESNHMKNKQALWKQRGYQNSRWIHQNNFKFKKNSNARKYVLSLGQYSNYNSAKNICIAVRRKYRNDYCKVIQRTDIPALGKAKIRTANNSFSTSFDGILSIDVNTQNELQILNTDVNTTVKESAHANQSYRGIFYVISNNQSQLDLVQKTRLGDYLKHVVPAEIFPNAPMEALKAQSVIARTYTLKHFEPLSGQAPYHICGDTRCQVYRGYKFEHPKSNQAIVQTHSMFLMHQHNFAETFYHSMCGGHTESKDNVWGKPKISYLNGVSDRILPIAMSKLESSSQTKLHLSADKSAFFCGATQFSKDKFWSWEKTLSSQAIQKKLGNNQKISAIKIISRGTSGRVLHLNIIYQNGKHKALRGELNIRRFFSGLKSSLFTIDRYWKDGQAHYSFKGRGFGHGAGMCQIGAIGRAEHGQDYQEILNAYYPGTQLVKSKQ